MRSYLLIVGLISWKTEIFLRMSLLISMFLKRHFLISAWVWCLCQAGLCGCQGYCLFVPLVTASPTWSFLSWPGMYQKRIIMLLLCFWHLYPVSSIPCYVAVSNSVAVSEWHLEAWVSHPSKKVVFHHLDTTRLVDTVSLCLVNTSIPLGEVVPMFLCLTCLHLCFWELFSLMKCCVLEPSPREYPV